jgi:succinate-acetate transporter protein
MQKLCYVNFHGTCFGNYGQRWLSIIASVYKHIGVFEASIIDDNLAEWTCVTVMACHLHCMTLFYCTFLHMWTTDTNT